MDAKVLRAAVSAAIRVTVSTTLIGCGGNVSTDTGRAASAPAVKDSPGNTGQPSAKATDEPASTSHSKPTASTGGSAQVTETPGAGTSSRGGAETGGVASLAGAGGDEASAGAPADVCGAAALACIESIEQTDAVQPLSDATQACCDVVLAAIALPPQLSAECFANVNTRFMQGGARQQCCHDPSTWQQPACTPWGPPVPPEFSRAMLQAWSLAA